MTPRVLNVGSKFRASIDSGMKTLTIRKKQLYIGMLMLKDGKEVCPARISQVIEINKEKSLIHDYWVYTSEDGCKRNVDTHWARLGFSSEEELQRYYEKYLADTNVAYMHTFQKEGQWFEQKWE